jgi:hypothetical protein
MTERAGLSKIWQQKDSGVFIGTVMALNYLFIY